MGHDPVQMLPEPPQPQDTSAQAVVASTLFSCPYNNVGATCAIAAAFDLWCFLLY